MKRKAAASSKGLVSWDVPDPLKDTQRLTDAAHRVANRVKEEKGTMTAMQFCLKVLEEEFHLSDFGIGQRQRIDISKARKKFLGKEDQNLIHSPPKAPSSKSTLPSTKMVYEQLVSQIHSPLASQKTMEERLMESFDKDKLLETGMLHIPGIVPDSDINGILAELTEREENSKLKWAVLRETTGNGKNGAYATVNNPPRKLISIQKAVADILYEQISCDSGSKMIYLKYGPGGVNWAHQDQSQYPFQAFLLLSRPKVDFVGGNLYVCDPSTQQRNEIAFETRGDIAIFAANTSNPSHRPFYHGMTEVRWGEGGEKQTHRLALGLLQT